jgi:PTS system mannitol-specific IIA component
MFKKKSSSILKVESIQIGLKSESRDLAIERAGNALLSAEYVEESYIKGMHLREQLTSTYIGSSVAIPHGSNDHKKYVKETGIVILQYPDGVDFGDDNTAHLVIGIAAKGEEHIDILMTIADAVSDPDVLKKLIKAKSEKKLYSILLEKGFGEA